MLIYVTGGEVFRSTEVAVRAWLNLLALSGSVGGANASRSQSAAAALWAADERCLSFQDLSVVERQ